MQVFNLKLTPATPGYQLSLLYLLLVKHTLRRLVTSFPPDPPEEFQTRFKPGVVIAVYCSILINSSVPCLQSCGRGRNRSFVPCPGSNGRKFCQILDGRRSNQSNPSVAVLTMAGFGQTWMSLVPSLMNGKFPSSNLSGSLVPLGRSD